MSALVRPGLLFEQLGAATGPGLGVVGMSGVVMGLEWLFGVGLGE